MGKLKKCLLMLIIPFIGLLNVKALSDEYTFNGSKIGGLGYGTSDNNLRVEANQYNTISMNLILNYYHYYGEVESPIKSSDTTNVVFVSCIHKDAIIDGVFSSKVNYLDLSYVSDEKCTFTWETSPTDGRVQYTFARLKYSQRAEDQIDNESGTIWNWWYLFNNQSFGVQGLSFASSLYFSDIRFYTSSEYNTLLSQYRSLNGQKVVGDKISDTNDKLDEAENTRKGILGTIKDVLSNIISLPKKIVEFLVDALKSLFIPEDMSFLDDFKETISNKLGFIAQVPIAVIDFGIDLVNLDVEEMTSVTFPTVEIFGVHFWPEMEVDITPIMSKFSSLKYLTDVLCVTMCVSTLNRWREKFTGGGEAK